MTNWMPVVDGCHLAGHELAAMGGVDFTYQPARVVVRYDCAIWLHRIRDIDVAIVQRGTIAQTVEVWYRDHEPRNEQPVTTRPDVEAVIDRLRAHGYARSRNADHEPRTVTLTDDEAVELVEHIHSLASAIEAADAMAEAVAVGIAGWRTGPMGTLAPIARRYGELRGSRAS